MRPFSSVVSSKLSSPDFPYIFSLAMGLPLESTKWQISAARSSAVWSGSAAWSDSSSAISIRYVLFSGTSTWITPWASVTA